MNEFTDIFSYYGYIPCCGNSGLPTDVLESISFKHINNDEEQLMEIAIRSFKKAVNKELEISSDKGKHVIPLSAGLDSRAILAVLLDHPEINPSNIHTVCFGSPGTWDFEIGQQVAETAGVTNTTIDLTSDSFDWSIESIQDHVSDQTIPCRVLDGYINSRIESAVEKEAIIWSGFMGDPSSGGHQPNQPRKNWVTACESFAENERYCEGLAHPDFDPISVLPDDPFIEKQKLTYEEQLDFALRQQCLISPIVLHSDRYRTPFIQPSWLEFSLNLPPEHRRNRILFKKSFRTKYPKLFSLPTDANNGLPLFSSSLREWIQKKRISLYGRVWPLTDRHYIHPNTNYIDFGKAFRANNELRDTIKSLVMSFDDRNMANWIKPRHIWKEHQNGSNRSNDIRIIASLELHLREL
jgi:hypothetical protein